MINKYTMNVVKGTYRTSVYDFVTQYQEHIRSLAYTKEEQYDCIDMMMNGVLQYLKIYVINKKLRSCCKLIAIARDFLEGKIADRTGRYYTDYNNDERFYFAHCVKFDYMECVAEDETKVHRLIEIIGAIE
jgi:hypothetical protein